MKIVEVEEGIMQISKTKAQVWLIFIFTCFHIHNIIPYFSRQSACWVHRAASRNHTSQFFLRVLFDTTWKNAWWIQLNWGPLLRSDCTSKIQTNILIIWWNFCILFLTGFRWSDLFGTMCSPARLNCWFFLRFGLRIDYFCEETRYTYLLYFSAIFRRR